MATQLMAWDYEDGLVPVRDAEEDPQADDTTEEAKLIPRIAIAEGEEGRLRLFWQVLYYDTYGVFPWIPSSEPDTLKVHRRYVPTGALYTSLAVSRRGATRPYA